MLLAKPGLFARRPSRPGGVGLARCLTVLVAFGLLVSGCASHTWAPGPGMSAADFGPAKARCSLMARHGGGDFSAYGTPSFVAGAAVGNAIGESVRAQQDFNDCMEASGWRIADGQTAAAQNVAVGQLIAVRNERIACVEQVRSEPDYTPLLPHFSDLRTGKFTMQQLADERTPTPEEGRLMASFVDAASPCITRAIEAMSQIVPAIGPILIRNRSATEGIMVQLVQRKLTWGEAAQQQTQVQDDANAKMREARL
jgi:hypothetical protein